MAARRVPRARDLSSFQPTRALFYPFCSVCIGSGTERTLEMENDATTIRASAEMKPL